MIGRFYWRSMLTTKTQRLDAVTSSIPESTVAIYLSSSARLRVLMFFDFYTPGFNIPMTSRRMPS